MENPLQSFLEDPSISEILVNGLEPIWVEKQGSLLQTTERFSQREVLERYVRSILSKNGRKVDRLTPFADGRLEDGSRFCVVIDPAVLGGCHFSIRKFSHDRHGLRQLLESGFLSEKALALLTKFLRGKKNILISGATGSGKTTFLNALSELIAPEERIITLEDTLELRLRHPHVVRLEARPPNSEGEGEITLRQLLRAALRMRPDRLIVGECRGAEVCDLLQALNTGHQGSMATIHANSCRDALFRLELLLLLHSQGMNTSAVKSYIGSSIQVILHVEKVQGHRKLKAISELTGMEENIFRLREYEI